MADETHVNEAYRLEWKENERLLAALASAVEARGNANALSLRLAAENRRLRELLHEVATPVVAFEDDRLGYVEVQMDLVTWREILALEASDGD